MTISINELIDKVLEYISLEIDESRRCACGNKIFELFPDGIIHHSESFEPSCGITRCPGDCCKCLYSISANKAYRYLINSRIIAETNNINDDEDVSADGYIFRALATRICQQFDSCAYCPLNKNGVCVKRYGTKQGIEFINKLVTESLENRNEKA